MTKSIDTTVFGPLQDEVAGQVKATPDETLANPWPRYWSRMLDLTLGLYTVGIVIGIAFPTLLQMPIFAGRIGEAVVNLISMPVVMIIDAVVLALFGNTLGRLIIGIRVETAQFSKPSLLACLDRNALLYVFGLGLGIPLVGLFTAINGYTAAKNNDLVRWDAKAHTRVFDRGNNPWRTTLTAALFIGVGVVPSVISSLGAAMS